MRYSGHLRRGFLATRLDAAELQSDLLESLRRRDPGGAEAAMEGVVEHSARHYRRHLADIVSQSVEWEFQE